MRTLDVNRTEVAYAPWLSFRDNGLGQAEPYSAAIVHCRSIVPFLMRSFGFFILPGMQFVFLLLSSAAIHER